MLLPVLVLMNVSLIAQNDLTTNIIEGGKTLVELIRVLKPQKQLYATPGVIELEDSCKSGQQADLCFKNTDTLAIKIYLYKRNGSVYETVPLTILVPRSTHECLFAIRSGIYKYRMETEMTKDEVITKIVLREGEMKLKPCDRVTRNIKAE